MTDALLSGLVEDARSYAEAAIALRREIHREPELGLDNPSTQHKILNALDGLGLEISTGSGLSSVVADLVGGRPGPTIMLRADTDALPMPEESGEPFSSAIEGRAHSCGHDAHVAMLVGAARLLCARRAEIPGRIRFIFQPGEEGPGGAAVMIDEGVLDGVDAAFAIHISPNLPTGWVSSRPGPLMAATDDFEITITGKGAHASTPHFGNDPIPVACEVVTALQTFVTRRVDIFSPVVLTVGKFESGTRHNIIPESAYMEGTIRTVSEWTRLSATTGLERVANGVAAAHDCSAHVSQRRGYPVTSNHAEFVAFGETIARELFEDHYFELPLPVMGAEDFSLFLEQVPGAMFLLGACPADISDSLSAPSCHSNLMRLNEDCIEMGIALHAGVALAFLEEHADRSS